MSAPSVQSILEEANQLGKPTTPPSTLPRSHDDTTRPTKTPPVIESEEFDASLRKRTLITQIVSLQHKFPDVNLSEVSELSNQLAGLNEEELEALYHTLQEKIGG